MSWYPRQYPVLEQTLWELDTKEHFRPGIVEDVMLGDSGPQVAPGKTEGVYTSPLIDAGQAVAWKRISWRADLRLDSSVSVRTRFGATEVECLNARWSAPYAGSPASFSLSGSREMYTSVAAARFVQVRVELAAGTGGSPTLAGIRLEAELVPPACVGPVNLGIVEDGKPRFYWTRVEGAASYTLELSDSPDFSSEIFRQEGIAQSTFAYPREIRPGTYHWRVCAVDGLGQPSEFSPARRFTVGSRPHADAPHLRHPYLFFTRSDLPEIRKRLFSTHSGAWQSIQERAEKALEVERYDEKQVLLTPGQHSGFYETASRMARGDLEPLAFAYLITEDERYAAKAREGLLYLCGYSRWTGVPFGDPDVFYPAWQAALETAGITKGVATAYDWLHDYLTEDERVTVRAGLLRLGVLPIVESWSDPRTIRYIPRHQVPAGNWWSVCNSAGGIGALALLGEAADAQRWVSMAADAIRGYLVYPGNDTWNIDVRAGSGGQYLLAAYPNWGEDGGYIESIGYVDYGLVNAMYFVDALKRVTGEDLSPSINPKLVDQIYYFMFRGPDGQAATVNFNDSGGRNLSDDLYALLAKHLRSGRCRYMLDFGYPALKNIHAVLASDDTVPPEEPDLQARNALFRDIGWSVFRSGWGADASLMAAKFTHGRGHQDIGQYAIHYKGRPFIVDPGVAAYSDPIYREHLATTYAHNLVLVDGQCQMKADGRVLGFAETPGAGIVEADLTAAYQDLVSSWTRTLIYLEPESFVVIDRLRSDAPRVFTWQIHPNGRLAVQPRMGATIYQDDYEMHMKLLSPAEWRAVTKPGYIGTTPADYHSFEPEEPAREMLFVAVFAGTTRGRNIGVEKREVQGGLAVKVMTPEAMHVVLVSSGAETSLNGWGISTTALTCAITRTKGEEDRRTRWVIAGPGPISDGGKVIAEASAEAGYRAGACC